MSESTKKQLFPIFISMNGVSLAYSGIRISEQSDAPLAAVIGIVLALIMVSFGIREALRNRTE